MVEEGLADGIFAIWSDIEGRGFMVMVEVSAVVEMGCVEESVVEVSWWSMADNAVEAIVVRWKENVS